MVQPSSVRSCRRYRGCGGSDDVISCRMHLFRLFRLTMSGCRWPGPGLPWISFDTMASCFGSLRDLATFSLLPHGSCCRRLHLHSYSESCFCLLYTNPSRRMLSPLSVFIIFSIFSAKAYGAKLHISFHHRALYTLCTLKSFLHVQNTKTIWQHSRCAAKEGSFIQPMYHENCNA